MTNIINLGAATINLGTSKRLKVLIIGASGNFGGAVARELLGRGHQVTALVRPAGRDLASRDGALGSLQRAEGDVLDATAVARAARGQDVIVHAFNAPYTQWDRVAEPALQNVLAAAQAEGATVLFPGNVYGLGKDFDAPLGEESPREAPTRLGELRNRLERVLQEAASERGVRSIVLRAGDYFGPGASNTWFDQWVRRAPKGGPLIDPGESGVPHAWAYLPDLAHAAVDLLEQREGLQRYEEVNFAGHTLTSIELLAGLREALGDAQRPIKSFPWWALKLVSPFWPMGRELLRMRYLWQQPVLLDDGKLQRLLGPDLQTTPLVAALQKTLAGTLAVAERGANNGRRERGSAPEGNPRPRTRGVAQSG